jgi:hypothetical protein
MHLLYYHTNCADGYAALCIAHAALLARGIPAAEIEPRPINYGWPNQIPNVIDDSLFVDDHIYYLDYTPPAVDLALLLAELATWDGTIKLTLIDHHEKMAPVHGWHKDEQGQWQKGPAPSGFESVFAFDESGASLTWKHFHPDMPMPDAVTLIARRDLGHAFQDTDDKSTAALNAQALDLHAYLFRLLPRTFDAWTPLLLAQEPLSDALAIGSRLRSADRSIIDEAAMRCHWIDFTHLISPSPSLPSGFNCIPAINGLGPELVSDACQTLLRLYASAPFAASWWTDAKTGRITYSLRSRIQGHPDGHTNVCDIAKACHPDGGGHACAAGFSSTLPVPLV